MPATDNRAPLVPSALLGALLCMLCVSAFRSSAGTAEPAPESSQPVVLDPDLELRLFADASQVVTPIGVAVDGRGRVFVVESHTHSPPRDYAGPRADRIKVFEDRDGDGRADAVRVFAEGFEDALGIAFAPSGELLVSHRMGLVALRDRDGDLECDERAELLRLETRQEYDHSCLLGVAVSHDGRAYVSRGNVGGHPWAIIGSDGSRVAGHGDGGNIVRCDLDGGGVREVATGFWNPFGMDFDSAGRLLCADNDPDARGPNRLVHVIEGGDYGFKALYGGRGTHSYDAWNGELPGTLPYAAGTGEAPSGVLDCERAALPPRYRGSALATVWGGHTVDVFDLRPAGHSLRGEARALVKGGRDFRPVGIAAGPDGAVYITDWVRKDYPNHGEGRVWRLAARSGIATMRPRAPFAAPAPDPATLRLETVLQTRAPEAYDGLIALRDAADPFLRSAAVTALAGPAYRERLERDLGAAAPGVRLLALLALRRGGAALPGERLERLLADRDETVRRMALVWIGETRRVEMRDALARALRAGTVSPVLLRTYLDTVEALSPEAIRAVEAGTPGFSIRRRVDERVLATMITDGALPPELRALAVMLVERPDAPDLFEPLVALAREAPPPLRAEAVRTLAASARATDLLLEIARDAGAPAELRADAIVGLAHRGEEVLAELATLAGDPARDVRVEAARALRFAGASDGGDTDADTRPWPQPDRPATDEERLRAVGSGGDPASGRRVFFHPAFRCSSCHAFGGRGGATGPDLSGVAASKSREEVARSILRPSEEVSIEFQSYAVITKRGEVLNGLQFHFRDGGKSVSLILEDGREVKVPLRDVLRYEVSESSLMPEGLAERMTVEELRDLLAFLMAAP